MSKSGLELLNQEIFKHFNTRLYFFKSRLDEYLISDDDYDYGVATPYKLL